MGNDGRTQTTELQLAAHHKATAPLEGVVVLDFGTITAGAATSRLLADYGATVIKIESHSRPDPFRTWGMPGLADRADAQRWTLRYSCPTTRASAVCASIRRHDGTALLPLAAGPRQATLATSQRMPQGRRDELFWPSPGRECPQKTDQRIRSSRGSRMWLRPPMRLHSGFPLILFAGPVSGFQVTDQLGFWCSLSRTLVVAPPYLRRQAHEDRLYASACSEAKRSSAVVQKIKLHVTPPSKELPLALFLRKGIIPPPVEYRTVSR